MRKVYIVMMIGLGMAASAGARAQAPGQGMGVKAVLESVEANNLSLRAHSDLAAARTLGARTGNSLENPEVEYNRNWGKPSGLGTENELTVIQTFDFPTAYATRGRLAAIRGRQFAYGHDALRQQILLEAESLCIKIIAGRQLLAVARRRLDNVNRLCGVYARRLETGEGTVLEKNKVELERVAAGNRVNLVEIELEEALGRLSTLNGGLPLTFADSTYSAPVSLEPLAEMAARYRLSDPGLLASGAELEAAGQAVKVSRAEILPRLEVGYKHEFAPGEKFHGVIVGMSVPVFAGRRELKQAKAEAVYARAQYNSDLNDVQTALTSLYARAGVLAASLEEYRRMSGESQQYESFLNRALEAGQISVVDYFTEMAAIYDVRESEIRDECDYRLIAAQINAVNL